MVAPLTCSNYEDQKFHLLLDGCLGAVRHCHFIVAYLEFDKLGVLPALLLEADSILACGAHRRCGAIRTKEHFLPRGTAREQSVKSIVILT